MQKLFIQCLCVVSSLFLSLASHAEPGVGPGQIIIGQSIALNAGKNSYGMDVMTGIKLYLDRINEQGGVNGRRIELRTLDDENQSDKAYANARQLIDQGAFILFGSIEGGPSTAVMKAALESKIPFIAPMAGSPTLRRPFQPMVFPVRAEHKAEFKEIIKNARLMGKNQLAFMRSDSETGLQHLENVKLLCKELGAELALDLPFKSDISAQQIDSYAQKIQEKGIQFVFNHGSIGVYEKLIRALNSQATQSQQAGLGHKMPSIYAVNSGSVQLAKNLGPLAKGIVFAQVLPSPWERKTAITREYQDAFKQANIPPSFTYGSLEGYVSAKVLVHFLKAAGPNLTRASLLSAMSNVSMVLADMPLTYTPTEHRGMTLVDLSMVNADGKFLH